MGVCTYKLVGMVDLKIRVQSVFAKVRVFVRVGEQILLGLDWLERT